MNKLFPIMVILLIFSFVSPFSVKMHYATLVDPNSNVEVIHNVL